MSVRDYLSDSSSEAFHKEFLAIVESPANRIDSYQEAAERLTARLEVADDRGIKGRYFTLDNGGRFASAHLGGPPKGYVSFSGHGSRFTESNAVVPVYRDDSVADRRDESTRATSIGYSIYYRICWIFIGFVGLIWGFVFGASAVGAGWIDLTTGLAGTIGVVGLMVTLFVAGRRSTQVS